MTKPQDPLTQLTYWKRDLRYKRLSLLLSVAAFSLIISGLYFNYRQLRLSTAQSERVEATVRINVQTSVVRLVTDLDRMFIEKPYLRAYFYDGKRIDEKDPKYSEVSAVAEMVLDVFDLVGTQSVSFRQYYDDPEVWDRWIIDMFATSPILRATFDESADWYDKTLKDLRKRGQEKFEAKSPPPK